MLQNILNATMIHVCMVAFAMKILGHSNVNARMDIKDNVVKVTASSNNTPITLAQKLFRYIMHLLDFNHQTEHFFL